MRPEVDYCEDPGALLAQLGWQTNDPYIQRNNLIFHCQVRLYEAREENWRCWPSYAHLFAVGPRLLLLSWLH